MSTRTMTRPSAKLGLDPEGANASADLQNLRPEELARNAGQSTESLAKTVAWIVLQCQSNRDNSLLLIAGLIKVGRGLIILKKQAEHGNWTHWRDKAGFGETQAVRLMQLAGSWLADEILTTGQDLAGLPTDVQKLVKLVTLSRDDVKRLIAEQDFDDMNRSQVREVVEARLLTKQALDSTQCNAVVPAHGHAPVVGKASEPASSGKSKPASEPHSATKPAPAALSKTSKPATNGTPKNSAAIDHFVDGCHELAELKVEVIEDFATHPQQQQQLWAAIADTEKLLSNLRDRLAKSAKAMKGHNKK